MTMVKGFTNIGIGVIAVDIEEDATTVAVYLAETLPSADGELADIEEIVMSVTDVDGNTESVNTDRKITIIAQWLPNSETNRLEPPTVCRGELVNLYQFADTDLYYWTTLRNELHLRKLEKRTIILSNKRKIDLDDTTLLEKVYYFCIDTINKFVSLHTDDSDGEHTTYDFEIDTKNGKVLFTDGKGNYTLLDSVDENITSNINNNSTNTVGNDKTTNVGNNETSNISNNKYVNVGNEYRITTNKYTVTNNTCELIATLIEWLEANKADIGVGNLKFPVPRSPGTIASYDAIISKLRTFL